MTLSADAAALLHHLITIDQGDGIIVEGDAEIDPVAVAELEAEYFVQQYPLMTGGGVHILLLPRAYNSPPNTPSNVEPAE